MLYPRSTLYGDDTWAWELNCNATWLSRPTKTGQCLASFRSPDPDPCQYGTMLDRGANKNAQTDDSKLETALHIVCRKGYDECVELLIDRSVLPNARDAEGKTPLDRAEESGHTKCANLLRDYMKAREESTETELGIWPRHGVPPDAKFSRPASDYCKTEEDERALQESLSRVETAAGQCKTDGNNLFKEKEYGRAAEKYTEGLRLLCELNEMCTALPPARDQNEGENTGSIPQDIEEWNFCIGNVETQDNFRMFRYGGMLHAAHPITVLRTQLLTNRALCFHNTGHLYSAKTDCEAAFLVDPSNAKALSRYASACDELADIEKTKVEKDGTPWGEPCGSVEPSTIAVPEDLPFANRRGNPIEGSTDSERGFRKEAAEAAEVAFRATGNKNKLLKRMALDLTSKFEDKFGGIMSSVLG